MARSALSLPPERQTAILSPCSMRRYCDIALKNGVSRVCEYAVVIDCMTVCAFVSARLLLSIN